MAKRVTKTTDAIEEMVEIHPIQKARVTVRVLGTSMLVMNRMPKKAREQLLLPSRPKNKAERQTTLKHDPVAEFRDSIYRCRDDAAPTLIHLPTGAFKKAIAQAAIDIPGATKAQIGRLVSVADATVYLYGKPWLYMDVVRQAGMTRAPDIRTRAAFPEWACKVQLSFIKSLIRERDILHLFAAAGIITGIGDGRTEKGSRDCGQWEIVGENSKEWNAIINKQGRKVQEEAMKKPETLDLDSEELLSWYQAEVIRREMEPQSDQDDADLDEAELEEQVA